MKKLIDEGVKVIKVVSDDTNILVMLIHFYRKWNALDVEIYMERFCDHSIFSIKHSAAALDNLCGDLIGLHCISGCDTVSYPFGKGKKSAFSLLSKIESTGLQCIGEINTSEEALFKVVKQFFLVGMEVRKHLHGI